MILQFHIKKRINKNIDSIVSKFQRFHVCYFLFIILKWIIYENFRLFTNFQNSWIKKLHHFRYIKKLFTTSNELIFVYMLCKKITSKIFFVNQFLINLELFVFHYFSFTCSNRVVFKSILYLIYSKTMVKKSI